MALCDVCGNDYEPSLRVTFNGEMKTFDCFECAVHALAPTCNHCGIRIIGHGLQAGTEMYCCAHCARGAGINGMTTHLSASGQPSAGMPGGE